MVQLLREHALRQLLRRGVTLADDRKQEREFEQPVNAAKNSGTAEGCNPIACWGAGRRARCRSSAPGACTPEASEAFSVGMRTRRLGARRPLSGGTGERPCVGVPPRLCTCRGDSLPRPLFRPLPDATCTCTALSKACTLGCRRRSRARRAVAQTCDAELHGIHAWNLRTRVHRHQRSRRRSQAMSAQAASSAHPVDVVADVNGALGRVVRDEVLQPRLDVRLVGAPRQRDAASKGLLRRIAPPPAGSHVARAS